MSESRLGEAFSRGAAAAPLLVPLLAIVLALTCRQSQEAGDDDRLAEGGQNALPGDQATAPAHPTPAAAESLPTSAAASPETVTTTPDTAGDRGAASGTGGGAEAGGGAQAAARAGDGAGSDGVNWMQVDEVAKKVTFEIVAGLTPTNSAWNFNGYANGELTITVPVDWAVVMNFSSRDADVPHSLYVVDEQPPFQAVMPDGPDIPRAYSINLKNGIGPGKKDTLRFTPKNAGKYAMPCGVPGHAASGMWDWFVVSAEATRPSVAIRS